jgi:hypothetical protein
MQARRISALDCPCDALCLRRDLELFDLVFDVISESRSASAIYNAMIERE